jgi:hypothetical protein
VTTTFSLDQIRVASPCPMRWEDMTPVGDGQTVRQCAQCNLNVHDLSAMTPAEVEHLVLGASGRLCATFFRRADGTVLTRNCPVGLRAARARAARMMGRVAAGLALLLTGGALAGGRARGADGMRVDRLEPFETIRIWLTGRPAPQQFQRIAGSICEMSPTPSSGASQ